MTEAIQEKLSLLHGTWKGSGQGKYPTIDAFEYEETLRFEPTGPHIARYVARDVDYYGQTVPAGSAMDYVSGYTCFNDVTARSVQKEHMADSLPWMQSKNYQTMKQGNYLSTS